MCDTQFLRSMASSSVAEQIQETLEPPSTTFEKTLKTRKQLQVQLGQATTALDDMQEDLDQCIAVQQACERIYKQNPELLAKVFNDASAMRTNSRAASIGAGLAGLAAGALTGGAATHYGYDRYHNRAAHKGKE